MAARQDSNAQPPARFPIYSTIGGSGNQPRGEDDPMAVADDPPPIVATGNCANISAAEAANSIRSIRSLPGSVLSRRKRASDVWFIMSERIVSDTDTVSCQRRICDRLDRLESNRLVRGIAGSDHQVGIRFCGQKAQLHSRIRQARGPV